MDHVSQGVGTKEPKNTFISGERGQVGLNKAGHLTAVQSSWRSLLNRLPLDKGKIMPMNVSFSCYLLQFSLC